MAQKILHKYPKNAIDAENMGIWLLRSDTSPATRLAKVSVALHLSLLKYVTYHCDWM